jgi:hypothetical protein
MRRSLIAAESTLWQNGWGLLAAVILIPVMLLLLKLVTAPFGRPVQRNAEEVAHYLRDYIEGIGGEWDFDDFAHMRIADARLDAIRDRASRVREPNTEECLDMLRGLLIQAEPLGAAERARG